MLIAGKFVLSLHIAHSWWDVWVRLKASLLCWQHREPTRIAGSMDVTLKQKQQFTFESALKVCTSCPNEHCSICQELLQAKPLQGIPIVSSEAHRLAEEYIHVVIKTSSCNHYFHYSCILTWICRDTPPLNTCPLCRAVLFGSTPVKQHPANVPLLEQFSDSEEELEEQFIALWDRLSPLPPFNTLGNPGSDESPRWSWIPISCSFLF